MTQGRTRPSEGEFDLIAVVVATQPAGAARADLHPEQAAILNLCQRPLSVAEVSAHLHLPLGTVRVLLGDLLSAGQILTSGPRSTAQPQRHHLLKAVINGLNAL
ncbi:DUF742 domain-containing protein [Dactylosporangium aurantiacum]|uniref:DUF742 domain-containing protein n=2 Tax=Dactylosporangium aurantiacum TaxID=35754 RepID=A0A9Q9IU79_9ACTN|nr:DUF742 domain-containing protein [Dactylosporangium aurantiacum]MDG6105631.1 DUF742 domain-containing protein [Dactylosporangium aurantiacum]UWZ59520.1 DUF742 domain-containing protein [Dactylosporangium aurantiacum]